MRFGVGFELIASPCIRREARGAAGDNSVQDAPAFENPNNISNLKAALWKGNLSIWPGWLASKALPSRKHLTQAQSVDFTKAQFVHTNSSLNIFVPPQDVQREHEWDVSPRKS